MNALFIAAGVLCMLLGVLVILFREWIFKHVYMHWLSSEDVPAGLKLRGYFVLIGGVLLILLGIFLV